MSGDITSRVIELIVKSLNPNVAVTEDSRFVEDLQADSLDMVELVMALEEEFGVEIPDEETQKIKTVKDAINYIASKPS